MPKPNSFILSTDFATLRNDQDGTTSVTIPGSAVVLGNGFAQATSDVTVGTVGSSTRIKLNTSRDASKWNLVVGASFTRTGVVSGSPAPYTIFVNTYRVSAAVLRLDVSIQNPYSSALTGQSGNETFTINVKTLITPFA